MKRAAPSGSARSAGRTRRGHADGGSVSVEFALVLPAVVALLAGILSVARWASEQSAVETAAAAAARAAAVSSDASARAVAQEVAGAPVTVTISRDGELVVATVVGHAVVGLPVEASAVAVAVE